MAARREVQSILQAIDQPSNAADARAPAQGGTGLPLGCDPGAGCRAPAERVLVRTCAVASPQAGASEGRTGFPLGCDPVDAQGPAGDAPWPAPLSHPRTRGPCSELRRPLLHAAVRTATRRDGTSFRARRCCLLLIWAGQTSSLAPSRSSKIVSIAHVNDYEIGSSPWEHCVRAVRRTLQAIVPASFGLCDGRCRPTRPSGGGPAAWPCPTARADGRKPGRASQP